MKHIYHKEDAEVVRIEGEAPRTLYTLIQPNTANTEHFSMGLEEIDPNSEIPIHSHSEAEEIIFVYGGQGKAFVGDEVADLKPGTVIYLPPNVEHRFVNTGDEPLWITWTLSPPGFEKQIRKIADGSAGMEVFNSHSTAPIDDDLQMDPTNWRTNATAKHFTYKAETDRPWKPETILELLEQAHQEFERRMGPGLDTVIEVEDQICEPNNLGARAEINKQIHSAQDFTIEVKFICEFPPNYGHTEQERDLAYHFFVHELFHCWIGGNVLNDHGQIVEAITQYMTDWTLVHLGYCSEDLLVRGQINSQQIIETAPPPHTTIAKYKLLFHQMHTDNPENLLAFCRDLATCFRQQRNPEETDISPVLHQYLGTVSEED